MSARTYNCQVRFTQHSLSCLHCYSANTEERFVFESAYFVLPYTLIIDSLSLSLSFCSVFFKALLKGFGFRELSPWHLVNTPREIYLENRDPLRVSTKFHGFHSWERRSIRRDGRISWPNRIEAKCQTTKGNVEKKTYPFLPFFFFHATSFHSIYVYIWPGIKIVSIDSRRGWLPAAQRTSSKHLRMVYPPVRRRCLLLAEFLDAQIKRRERNRAHSPPRSTQRYFTLFHSSRSPLMGVCSSRLGAEVFDESNRSRSRSTSWSSVSGFRFEFS